MKLVFAGVKGAGVLDYVTGWYLKAAQYIKDSKIKVAFVSTNSISQGEQVGILWGKLFSEYGIKIHFAHRTFNWKNEASGNAAVHVVIVGFANFDIKGKLILEYEDINGEPHEKTVNNINPYLVESEDIVIIKRNRVLCNVPDISFGSMPNDGGYLILKNDKKNEVVASRPHISKFIRPFLGSYEFINNVKRWCLWLKDVSPSEYRNERFIIDRIKSVKEKRESSTRLTTQKLAEYPMLFGEIRQPKTDYLLIPGVSSENRKYIPIGFLSKNTIASNLVNTIADANYYLFGILTSNMHMTWVKYTCGRLKSDFRYSNTIVYNNYPWPKEPSKKKKKSVEEKAQQVLDVRAEFPDSSLADLYDPLTMPPKLVKAHQELDRAVDLCYRPQSFTTESARIEYLFNLYAEYTK